jgi:hypothetical protein
MHATLHYPPLDFKQLLEEICFVDKVTSCDNIFVFMPLGASLANDARIDEQLAKPEERVYIFRVKKRMILSVRSYLLNQKNQALPICKLSIVIRKHKLICDAVLWMAWKGKLWQQSSMS